MQGQGASMFQEPSYREKALSQKPETKNETIDIFNTEKKNAT